MKKTLLLLVCGVFAIHMQAQSFLGGTISLDYNFLRIVQSNLNQDSIKSVAQEMNPLENGGLSIGVPFNIKLHRFVMLRPQVVFNLMLNKVKYEFQNGEVQYVKVQNINVEFPVQLLLSDFKKRAGLGVILGARAGYNIQQQTQEDPRAPFLNFQKGYGMLDVGLGYRIKLGKKTTIMPELRYSLGLNNQIVDASSAYHVAIETIKSNRASFVLNIF